jgi:flagellar hook-associated protein FlgK
MHTVSSNLANASTPGYHLQRARLAETQPTIDGNHRIGAGVTVSHIDRLRSTWVEQSLLRNTSSSGEVSARLEAAQQLDTLFNPTDSSLHARTQKFFEAWQDLTSRPADSTLRRDLLAAADGLASEINEMHSRLIELERDFDAQISETVGRINQLGADIAALNRQIAIAEASGTAAHDLADRRDQLASELSELIDIRSLEGLGQPNAFSAANGAYIISARAPEFGLDHSSGQYLITVDGWVSPLPPSGGRLAGLITARDAIIGGARAEIDRWGTELVRSVDQLHAQGLGLNGPFAVLSGERGLTSVTDPIARASADFPVEAGRLTLTMTDRATGQRTVHTVLVEPGLDSLTDIAARLDAVPHLAAQVSDESGRLTLIADHGYGFEFTGRIATAPDMTGWTGTSDIEASGTYTGARNTDWTISVVGNGTVGVTPDLRAEVHDAGGNVIAVWNIGLGYAAGDALTTPDGITVRFGAGNVVDSQAAVLRVTADPDETGLLSALGLNSLFSGTTPGSFSVRQDLLDQPDGIAAAQSDQPGDNANAKAATGLSLARFSAIGGLTFSEALAQMTANAGSHVQEARTASDQFSQIQLDLSAQRQAISGVDPNEELVKLLEYQRMFQSAARFISTVNETLDELFTMMR